MRKLYILNLILLLSFSGIAQTVLFSEDFGTSFQDIFSGTNWECKYSSASSYNTSSGPCSSSGNYSYYLNGSVSYITTKQITLGASGNELSFDYSFNYYSFSSPEVLVSTSAACGNTGTDITGGTLVPTTCDHVSYDLDAYANQTIRLIFYSNTSSENFYFDNVEVISGGGGGTGSGLKWADTFNDNNTDLDFTGNDGDEDYSSATWNLVDGASIENSGSYTVNYNETEAFNTTSDDNSGYAVLLDKNESLESPTIDLSAEESFKVSFYAMKQGGSANWNSWTELPLEYWDGSAWQTLQAIKNDAMATSTENDYFLESGFGYHCFTVYKSSSSPGNYYYSSAPHVNSACFHSDFKLRWRLYEFSSSDYPQVYIDNITFRADDNGESVIPCGISYWNGPDATGYGQDVEATVDDHSKRGLEVEIDSPWETGDPDWSNYYNDGNTGVDDVYVIMYAVISEQKISTNNAKVFFILPDAKTTYSETMSIDNSYTGPGFLYYKKILADCSGNSSGTYDTGNGMTYYFLFEYSSDFRPVYYDLNSSGIEMGGGATDVAEFMNPEVCSAVLPVELLNFDVVCKNNSIEFNWSTASEINADYFLILRSNDGIDFTPITQISAAGNSSQEVDYQYVLNELVDNTTYFQLVQVDMDGTHHDWDIKSVNCGDFKNIQLKIFLNPINNGIFNLFSSTRLTNVRIRVFSLDGKLIFETEMTLNQGYNEIIHGQELKIGTYVISIVGNRVCEKLKGIVR
ncbi:MAG: T9SS type A sorting domain-containing protein [Bacteroidota bacterium]|nr:T9SS type A sorting domain-containing protein [Bacteroidota bacterium]